MILKLIVPKRKTADTELENWGGQFQSIVFGVKKYSAMIASIPVIAALTPEDVNIIIKDENIEDINFDEKVDLVGISANTSLATRAYEIADEFRKRNVQVVIGGIHTSMLPEEGLLHADTIVKGEAENIWKQVIEDFKNNNLKKIYESPEKPDINLSPIPRYDLLNNKKYNFHILQTTRGCPYNCEFCSVQTYFGKKYRCKSVEKVIKEIEFVNSIDKKLIFFCDDNFLVDKKRAKELLKAMIPLKTPYTIQATIEIYEDDELLDLLVASGCLSILIGFESINQKNLAEVHKGNQYKVDLYYKAIGKIQSKGIIILGSFIFGFDDDDINVFERTVNFIKDSGIGNCFVNILTPLPGTQLFFKLEKEKRILNKSWAYFDCCHVCYKPKNMSEKDLENGYCWAFQELFELNTVFNRLMKLYNNWNENNVRLNERIFPIIANLSSHYVAYSYPKAKAPK
ncbi:MAG: radical SAM protein [Candidatus Firestonebacteria bacterium]